MEKIALGKNYDSTLLPSILFLCIGQITEINLSPSYFFLANSGFNHPVFEISCSLRTASRCCQVPPGFFGHSSQNNQIAGEKIKPPIVVYKFH
jgi:hypothetical protein